MKTSPQLVTVLDFVALKVADGDFGKKTKINYNPNFLLDKEADKLGVNESTENCANNASKVDMDKLNAFEILNIYS